MEHMKYINNVYLAADADGKMICLVVKSAGVLVDSDGINSPYVVLMDPQRENTSDQSRLIGMLTKTGNTAVIDPQGNHVIVDLIRPILTADGKVQS
jgi:hypothetical protein